MLVALLVLWLVLAVAVAVVVGRGIRHADQREGTNDRP